MSNAYESAKKLPGAFESVNVIGFSDATGRKDWLIRVPEPGPYLVIPLPDDCLHDGSGEGDWCYSCWHNIETGESYDDYVAREVSK